MALYSFYPCKPDGTSESFLTYDLVDDDAARARAVSVLEQHPSAVHVAVWCGDRKVSMRKQMAPELRAAQSASGGRAY